MSWKFDIFEKRQDNAYLEVTDISDSEVEAYVFVAV
jgi:hypothetical protein